MIRWALVAMAAAGGCDDGSGATGDCDPGVLAVGEIDAELGGDFYNARGATWMVAGDGVQVTVPEADGWRVTLAITALPASVPATVTLGGDAPEGLAIFYPSGEGISYATNNGGSGTVDIQQLEPELQLCFDLIAISSDGTSIEAVGQVNASGG